MKRKTENKKARSKTAHHEYPLPGEINPEQKERNAMAHQQADKDMTNDAEFTTGNKNDDLDEGEAARLGEGKNDLI